MSQIGDDLLDLRDLQDRYVELTEEKENDPDEFFEDDELETLKKFMDENPSISFDEPTLILESYFEHYAQDLAEELFEVADHWPFTCIDWEQAAEELKVDYTTYEIDGCTYYQRS